VIDIASSLVDIYRKFFFSEFTLSCSLQLTSPKILKYCPSAQLSKQHAMKTYRGVDVKIHVFLTSVLMKASGVLHTTAVSSPRSEPPLPIV
jgi:hypothetical protein